MAINILSIPMTETIMVQYLLDYSLFGNQLISAHSCNTEGKSSCVGPVQIYSQYLDIDIYN